MQYPEFRDLISNYFLFCVTESKLDNHDLITLPGYKFISQPRRQKFLRRSGGIGVFVKDNSSPHISIIDSDSDYILWLQLSKSFFKAEDDLIFGVVYLPPTDSRFNNPDELELFEIEITTMSVLHKYMFLLGDFNARSSSEPEFIDADDFLAEHFGYDDTLNQFYNMSSLLTQYGFEYNRSSKDTLLNNEGNFLIDICKSNNLFIMNGRCGQDRGIGEFTFKNTSVIDYSIASARALQFVQNFNILELDCLFSDGHSLLTTYLNLKASDDRKKIKTSKNTKSNPKWNESEKQTFLLNIDKNKIQAINNRLCDLHQSNNVNTDDINKICTDIGSIFVSAAEATSGKSKSTSHKHISDNSKDSKPWFGYKCKNARRKYHIARKINNINPTNNNKSKLKETSKNYKRTMNFCINKFNHNMQDKLRNLKSKNPKDYWKFINSLSKKKDNDKIDIEILHEFFKNLNEQSHEADDDVHINIDKTDDDEILNSYITEGEILKCIKLLKNNKSSANDRIINEYIKSTADTMLPTYVAFFNLVFDRGIIPESWLEGIIRPIYKNNGDPKSPENYRPITILSCFGKLFTAVLNKRLTNFLDQHDTIQENQAGFRAGYSTLDHIFTLNSLIEILKFKKTKLYCSFVDFSKAFDSVWRGGLWMKLLGNSINGKMFQVIHNLYQNIKSCVVYSGSQSSSFQSFCGVRQGENLSPVLFSLFLNDMENFLETHHCTGIDFDIENDQLLLYLKIFVLLYADDTVIFGTDPDSFQSNLNVFYEYCQLWKLNINYKKTKIMIFGRRNYDGLEFKLGEHTINICDEFKYLGVVFSKSRSFYKAIKHNIDHAKKAMHLLYKRIRNLKLPLDLQIELFNHTILPILLYGCEI